ncbi:MAG: 30S ribosomal protein S17e [Candidatus Heimdallarchaeum aukensis]|uniref:Small ribosomal subunit protein eS17 n=2 Tax=Candidatus Heimdallarchaeum TaxID=3053649 RepID=A0A9Y1FNX3_9ARCH|nr:MAG: 30S ribosomal protein S17e [Candidatus Pacearchaeota archaeon]UJG40652.1 MAG: 30S ribosomal protein S17e [Candidatus Heimdallarchaeum aukensis]UJG43364.1 MAG: 30S ribosomal protein S17e [Candidatus Heimdallarchaeum endolithica]
MGNVRTSQIKKLAKQIVRDFHDQLNLDFQNNKHVVEQVCSPMTKHMRNRIAGYVTRIMRKFQDKTIQVLEEL